MGFFTKDIKTMEDLLLHGLQDIYYAEQQILKSLPDMIEKIAYELMSPDQIKTFETNWEMNLSFGVPNVGNFRVNIFRQRGSTSIVVRFILGNIPALDELGLPNILGELIMEKRGLILIVGATGSGKSTTLASMLDHRNANRSGHILTVEDPIEFLFKHKKSIVSVIRSCRSPADRP